MTTPERSSDWIKVKRVEPHPQTRPARTVGVADRHLWQIVVMAECCLWSCTVLGGLGPNAVDPERPNELERGNDHTCRHHRRRSGGSVGYAASDPGSGLHEDIFRRSHATPSAEMGGDTLRLSPYRE